MPRTDTYTKHIACLESLWNDDIEDRWSVRPILEVVANIHDLKLAHLSCNTREEFVFNLQMLAKRRRYRMLYVALHGGPGEVYLADETAITLEELAELMGTRFKDWVVHFGSCSTVRVPEERLKAFLAATDVAMVLGYTQDVDWLESAAMDLLVFQALQQYVDMAACWRSLAETYTDMIARTGLTVALR